MTVRILPAALLLLLLAPAVLAAPHPAPANPAAKTDPFPAFAAALARGDTAAAAALLSPALDAETRAAWLDPAQAKRSGRELARLRFRRQADAPGETWRIYEVPKGKEFLFCALDADGRILGLLPAGSDRVRRFSVRAAKGATDPAVAAILRARFAAFRTARAAVGASTGGMLTAAVAGFEEGDLPRSLLSARGAYALHRIVDRGKKLPFLPVYGAAERAPEAVDPKEILGPGTIRETAISYSATNLPQVKFSATPEGTRRLVRFHRECADPERAMLAFVVDGRIVNRIAVSRSLQGGVFWLDGFFKEEDAQFIRALVGAPPLPGELAVEEGEPL